MLGLRQSNSTFPPPPPITTIGNPTDSLHPTEVHLLFFTIYYPTLFTTEERDQLSASAASYAAARMGNSPGVTMAQKFRDALEIYEELPPDAVLTPEFILKKYTPLFVFAGFMFALFLAMLGLSIYFCARVSPRATTCGKSTKRGKLHHPTGFRPDAWKRAWLPLLLAIILLAFLIWGIVAVFWGTIQMGKELNIAVTALNEILLLVDFKISMIPYVIKATATNVNSTVVAAVERGGSWLNNAPALDKLDGIQARLKEAVVGVNQMDLLPTLAQDLTNIANKIDQVEQKIYNSINQINSQQIIDGFPFQILPEFQIPNIDPNRTGYIAKLANGLNNALNDANSKLSQVMKKVDDVTTALSSRNITETWSEVIQSSAQKAVDVVGGATQQSVDKATALYDKSLAKVINGLNGAEEQFYKIIKVLNALEVPRNVLTIVLEVCVIIFLIVATVAIIMRKPWLLANCSMAASAIVVISFLLCGIYLVVAALINESCYYMAANRWAVLLPTINDLAGTNISASDIIPLLDARKACASGLSPVVIAIQLVTALGQANEIDLQDVVSFINRTQQDLANNIQGIRDSVVTTVDNGMDKIQAKASIAAKEVREVATLLEQIQQQYVDPLINTLSTPRDWVKIQAAVQKLIDAGQAAINLDKVPDFLKNKVLDIILQQAQNLKTLLQDNMADLDAAVKLDDKLLTVVKKVDSIMENNIDRLNKVAGELDTLSATLTEGLLQVKDKIVDTVTGLTLNGTHDMLDVSGNVIAELVSCRMVVQDTFILQYAFCVGVGRSTDAMWFGFFLQAMTMALLIPCLMWLAKRIWNVDPTTWSWSGDVEKKAYLEQKAIEDAKAEELKAAEMAMGYPVQTAGNDYSNGTNGYASGCTNDFKDEKDVKDLKMPEMIETEKLVQNGI